MVAADAEAIAIAGDEPDGEVGVCDFDTGGDGGCAAVDGVEAVGVHVEREAAGAADAGDADELFARDAEFWEDALECVEDGVVAAAGAPADVIGGDEVLAGERGGGGGFGGHGVGFSGVEDFEDAFADFGDFERAAFDFVEGDGVDEVFGAEDEAELAEVEFGDEDFFESGEQLAEVGREWVEVVDVDGADVEPFGAEGVDGGGDGTLGAAPADDQEFSAAGSDGFGWG